MVLSIDGGLMVIRNEDPKCECDNRKDIRPKDCSFSFDIGLKELKKEWSFGLLLLVTNVLIIFIAIFLQKCERNEITEIDANDEFLTLTNPRQKRYNDKIDLEQTLNNSYLSIIDEEEEPDQTEYGNISDDETDIYNEIANEYETFYSCSENEPACDKIIVVSEENGYMNAQDVEMSIIVHKAKETAV